MRTTSRRPDGDEALGTAVSSLQTSLRIAESALRGVPAIVRPDGSVDLDAFQAYGADVLDAKTGTGMAYVAVVAGRDRAAFEATTGLTIEDQGADGQLVPAAVRDRYCPIVSLAIGPQGVAGSEGFDVCSSPPAARRGGRGRRDGRHRPDGAVRGRAERARVRLVVPPRSTRRA